MTMMAYCMCMHYLACKIKYMPVQDTNPLVFAMIREATAGPLLLCAALLLERKQLWQAFRARDLGWFCLTGLALFSNQLLFIVGLKLTNSTTASITQPSQPVFVTLLAVILGWERPSFFKLCGIICAVAGSTIMVYFASHDDNNSKSMVVGLLCFLGNCLGTAVYVILTKPLLTRGTSDSKESNEGEGALPLPPLSVTALSYIFASCGMVLSAVLINSSTGALDLICPGEFPNGNYCNENGPWYVPPAAIYALLYWIIFSSIMAYFFMTWGNKYAPASIVSVYTTLQPLTSAVLGYLFLKVSPSTADLGGFGIIAGLLLVAYDKRRQEEQIQAGAARAPLLESVR